MLRVVRLNVVEPHRLKRATAENTKGGSITVPLTSCFDWFGISCMTTDNFCFYLQNRLIQTCQTGGQQYSDTSPFSIPWQQHFPSLQSKLCYVGGTQKNPSNLNYERGYLTSKRLFKLLKLNTSVTPNLYTHCYRFYEFCQKLLKHL
jgi:hypothetical protein